MLIIYDQKNGVIENILPGGFTYSAGCVLALTADPTKVEVLKSRTGQPDLVDTCDTDLKHLSIVSEITICFNRDSISRLFDLFQRFPRFLYSIDLQYQFAEDSFLKITPPPMPLIVDMSRRQGLASDTERIIVKNLLSDLKREIPVLVRTHKIDTLLE